MRRSLSQPEKAVPDLFDDCGVRHAPELLTVVQESELVREFGNLPFKAFKFHGYLGNRRVVSFGHRYDYVEHALQSAEPIPPFLLTLLPIASRFAGLPANAFQQALVTEYAPGAGIGWHRDKPIFEDIVGFSFLAPCTLRLRRKAANGWDRRSVPLARRSAYLLSGEVRDCWEHSIAPMDSLRYSVTLRTFRAKEAHR